MFRRILVANRGEIALRIMRACREMNIETVAVYSTADAESLPVQFATQSVCIGGAKAADSYLNQNALLTAALATGCEAVHPGYGFLSENADFADKCAAAGLKFIGPSAQSIRDAGSKASACAKMRAAKVPTVPGSDGAVEDIETAIDIADKVGYPVLLKASAGGGGRGIRRCNSAEELPAAFAEAQAESVACFGNGEMYLEKCIINPRHIEFQIMADSRGNTVHLFDRDCSVQRRNQKLVEEAPAKCLTPKLRRKMGEAAVRAAKAVGYENAGTVEFLLDENNEFYFMEINTRVQVEHGITEMITGVDIVKEQIRIASGLPLTFKQKDLAINGHAIECRINAEDPRRNFAPCPGKAEFVHFPGGCGVRVDSCLYTGYALSPFYDSLVAKIMVHAPTRLEAVRRMRRALEELMIEGFPTTSELAHMVMYHPDYIRGICTTAFLDKNLKQLTYWNRRADGGEEE